MFGEGESCQQEKDVAGEQDVQPGLELADGVSVQGEAGGLYTCKDEGDEEGIQQQWKEQFFCWEGGGEAGEEGAESGEAKYAAGEDGYKLESSNGKGELQEKCGGEECQQHDGGEG